MSAQAGIGLRIVQVAAATGVPGDDLETMIVNELPDGAFAFAVATQTLYALDKYSALTVASPTILTAVGGGRWIAQNSGLSVLYGAFVNLVVATGTPTTGALVQSTWTALPSATSQYASVGSSAVWSAATASGILTYSGPTRAFLVMGQISGLGAGTTTNYGFSVSRSNAAIIGTTTDQNMEGQAESEAAADKINMSFFGVLTALTAGQTIQGAVRNLDDTGAFVIHRYQLALIPLA